MMRGEIYGKTLRFFLAPVADLLYEDESVTEVLINGPSNIYCERGGRLETEALQGEVVRLGRDLGVPTPVNLALYVYLATADVRRRPPG